MRKRTIISTISAGVLLLGVIGSSGDSQPSSYNQTVNNKTTTKQKTKKATPKPKPTCDGSTITTGCIVDGVSYKTYIYHPAVAEKSHTETVTTYVEKVTSYCTLCNDGTYSPSCATGRGTCSHHGGVAQWNAPRTSSVPEYSTKTVVDAPAQEAYYEKIVQ